MAETTADFVIVGGGTSGLLLANLLVSSPTKPTVLVLEAGEDRSSLAYRNPSQRYLLPFIHPELDHGYTTVPQVSLGGRQVAYPRGKGLGGSTLINFLLYLSGSKEDYNYWADLVGDDTWKWENSHRRLRELENFHGAVADVNKGFAHPSEEGHGYDGPVDVGLPFEWEEGTKDVIEEYVKAGVPLNLDINSGNPIGVGMSPVSAANGYRTTSASANLRMKPDNLMIVTDATVKGVVFEDLHAVGVQLIDGRKFLARKEVILSAGTLDTPKILILSGVGPCAELEKHNIPVIKHIPGIGQSMKDHPVVFLTALMEPGFTTRVAFENDTAAVEKETAQWNRNGTGRLASEMQSLAVMFNKIPSVYETEEFHALPEDVKEYLKRDAVPTYEATTGGPKFPPNLVVPPGKEYLGISVFGMNPQGEGNVKLASSDPKDAVVIDSKAFTHPFDRRVFIDSVIDTLRLFKKTKQYKEGFLGWLMGPKSDSREDVEQFLVEQAFLVWHANGTVKMGKKDDEKACVDTDFRVKGLSGLRVVDMSVAPITINGHTQAQAYLIGKTAADKLIKEYRL